MGELSFKPKYEVLEDRPEEQEYARIWERDIAVARRSLGKGAAEDKLVLCTAVWQVLNARNVEEELTMDKGSLRLTLTRRRH